MTEKVLNSLQQQKRQRILEVASPLFLRDGFKNVSMDAIAEAAPVSKATLYNHFADKKALFSAVIDQRCQALAAVLEQNLTGINDPEKALMTVARQFLMIVLTPESLRMHRTIIAEAGDFPELGRLFYESGPQRLSNLLAHYLQTLHEANILDVPNPRLSTSFFFNALKGRHHMECLLGLRESISLKEQDELIDYAVHMFLKAHRK